MLFSGYRRRLLRPRFFIALLALCVVGRSARAMAETAASDSGVKAEQPFHLDADALLRVSSEAFSQWDEARCEAAMAVLDDAVSGVRKRLPALRKALDTARASLRNAGTHRRRLRRIQDAQEEHRTLNVELNRNLDRDPAVQALDGAMKALDALWQRLVVRDSLIRNRLDALAKETDKAGIETVQAAVALDDADALSRVDVHEIARWDEAGCRTVQERIQAHIDAVQQQRRPALGRERNALKAALRASDAYERQRRDVERAWARYVERNSDLEKRLDRDPQIAKMTSELQDLEEQGRRMRFARIRLANRLKHIRLVESRERTGEPNPPSGG